MPKLRHVEGEAFAQMLAGGAHPGEAYEKSGLPPCKDNSGAARRYRKNHLAIDFRVQELVEEEQQLSQLRRAQAEKLTADYIKSTLFRTIEVCREEIVMTTNNGKIITDEDGEPLRKIKDASNLMKALEKAGTLHNLFPSSSQSLQVKATIEDLSDSEKLAKIHAAAEMLSSVPKPSLPEETPVGNERSLGSGGDGEVQPAIDVQAVPEADGVPRRWKN